MTEQTHPEHGHEPDESYDHASAAHEHEHRLRLRWLGHALEASMATTVDCDLSVAEGHRVSEEVRHRLLHEVRRLDTAVIHVNPCGHAGEDPHAMTRHHDPLSGPPSIEVAQGGAGR
jgi:divalent metal cation (Fe/Co/Zn/Cd) transporter